MMAECIYDPSEESLLVRKIGGLADALNALCSKVDYNHRETENSFRLVTNELQHINTHLEKVNGRLDKSQDRIEALEKDVAAHHAVAVKAEEIRDKEERRISGMKLSIVQWVLVIVGLAGAIVALEMLRYNYTHPQGSVQQER